MTTKVEPEGKRGEVLQYLKQGLSAREIADKMDVTTKAVYAHRTRLIKSGFWTEKMERDARTRREFQAQHPPVLQTAVAQSKRTEENRKTEDWKVESDRVVSTVNQAFERARETDRLRSVLQDVLGTLDGVTKRIREAVGQG